MDDHEILALELDAHTVAMLRLGGSQRDAIEWMKKAFNLMEAASREIKKPRIYSVPGTYGVHTLMLRPPSGVILPPSGFKPQPPIWFGGVTVEYGDRYQNRNIAWTKKDTRRLERERKK